MGKPPTSTRTAPAATGAVPRLAYSVDEFAAALGLSRPSVYLMLQRGELRTITVGRRRLIPATEVERLLAGATEYDPL